jgi:5-methylcytosine-specific restriction endonuclease McrA
MGKVCTRCGIEKTKDRFSRDRTKRDGLRSYCKECAKASSKARNHNPDWSGTKKCTKCGTEKAKDRFSRTARNKDGLKSHCKECTGFSFKTYQATRHRNRNPDLNGTKVCTNCGIEKTKDRFSKSAGKKDGLQSWCKECVKPSAKAWYEANHEKMKASHKAWYKANPEKVREKRKRQRKAHPERHRERHREQAKRYRKAHPEIRRDQKRRRRARESGAPGKLDHEAVWSLYWNSGAIDRCWKCLKKITFSEMTVDHAIPLSWEGLSIDDPTNINLLCKSCNSAKHDNVAFYAPGIYGVPRWEVIATAIRRGLRLSIERLDSVIEEMLLHHPRRRINLLHDCRNRLASLAA